jgi:hypothetical protein
VTILRAVHCVETEPAGVRGLADRGPVYSRWLALSGTTGLLQGARTPPTVSEHATPCLLCPLACGPGLCLLCFCLGASGRGPDGPPPVGLACGLRAGVQFVGARVREGCPTRSAAVLLGAPRVVPVLDLAASWGRRDGGSTALPRRPRPRPVASLLGHPGAACGQGLCWAASSWQRARCPCSCSVVFFIFRCYFAWFWLGFFFDVWRTMSRGLQQLSKLATLASVQRALEHKPVAKGSAAWRLQVCTWLYALERRRVMWPHILGCIQAVVAVKRSAGAGAGSSGGGDGGGGDGSDGAGAGLSSFSLRRLHYDAVADGGSQALAALGEQRIRELAPGSVAAVAREWHTLLSGCCDEGGLVSPSTQLHLYPVR